MLANKLAKQLRIQTPLFVPGKKKKSLILWAFDPVCTYVLIAGFYGAVVSYSTVFSNELFS